jgi:hypothetical protein
MIEAKIRIGPVEKGIMAEIDEEMFRVDLAEAQRNPATQALFYRWGVNRSDIERLPGATGCLDDAEQLVKRGLIPLVLGK